MGRGCSTILIFWGTAWAVHVGLICEVLSLLALANFTPIMVKNLVGRRWAWPLDGGLRFFDGRAIFGASKTVRGVLASLVVTAAGSVAIGWGWELGVTVAAWSMGGDLFSSFCKRRLGLAPGGKATGLDQIPEALFPVLAVRGMVGLSAVDIGVVVVVFLVAEMLLSVVFFKMHLRERPY